MDKGMDNALGEPMHIGLTSGVTLLLNVIFNIFFDQKHANKFFIIATSIFAFMICYLTEYGGK